MTTSTLSALRRCVAGTRRREQQQRRQRQLWPVGPCSSHFRQHPVCPTCALLSKWASLCVCVPVPCLPYALWFPSAPRAQPPTQFRKLGYEAVDMICDYMSSVQDAKVVPDVQVGLKFGLHRQQ
jgi:hypothetical protein